MEKAKKKYYIAELKKLQNRNDVEANHAKADNIISEFLRELGYEDIAKEYELIPKWYA